MTRQQNPVESNDNDYDIKILVPFFTVDWMVALVADVDRARRRYDDDDSTKWVGTIGARLDAKCGPSNPKWCHSMWDRRAHAGRTD
jgi:hypothetical protein